MSHFQSKEQQQALKLQLPAQAYDLWEWRSKAVAMMGDANCVLGARGVRGIGGNTGGGGVRRTNAIHQTAGYGPVENQTHYDADRAPNLRFPRRLEARVRWSIPAQEVPSQHRR